MSTATAATETRLVTTEDRVGAEPIRDDLTPLLRWIEGQPEPPSVHLICDHNHDPVRTLADSLVVVRLDGCAAELSVATYLEVAATGVAALTVLTDRCPGADRVSAAMATANEMLAAHPHAPVVARLDGTQRGRQRRVYDLQRLPISRRHLLLLALPAPRSRPDVCAEQRTRTVAALRALRGSRPTPSALQEIPAPSAALLAHNCTACGVCVRVCPTGALGLHWQAPETVGRFTLLSSPADCTDCGRCVTLCPEGTLLRTGPLDWAQLVDNDPRCVAAGTGRTCNKCGASFAAGPAQYCCPVCTFRGTNPFGTWVPEGLTTPIAGPSSAGAPHA
jgi:ferredoxin